MLLGMLLNVGATAATEYVLALVEAATWMNGVRDDDDCVEDEWFGVDVFVNYDLEMCEDEMMVVIGGVVEADAYRVLAKTFARSEDANLWFIKEMVS